MWVLGFANSHNGAVALIKDGTVEVAIQLERLQRIKRFPLEFSTSAIQTGVYKAINYCLRHADITVEDIDAFAATTPWSMKGDIFWPHGKLHWVPHHLAHAEYVLHYSGLEPGLVLVVDAHGTHECDRAKLDIPEKVAAQAQVFPGEMETVSAYSFDGEDLSLIYRMCGNKNELQLLTGSIGQVWERGSVICFGARDQAGKVMGLAAYGNGRMSGRVLWLDNLGRLVTDMRLLADSSVPYRDLAHVVQTQTSSVLIELLGLLKNRTLASVLYYSGGVALNVVSNEDLIRSGLFDTVHMNGSCEDNGTAIGAALALHRHTTRRRFPERTTEYHGHRYSEYEILLQLRRFPVSYEELSPADLIASASTELAKGSIIAWHQGRSEFGPRALGNRSILASPCSRATKAILSGAVKHREAFRPYAASILEPKVAVYVDIQGGSPVMLRSAKVLDPGLPAITHVDGTTRVQTVSREDNPRFYELIQAFGDKTGKYVLLNTSLNVAGEPIAETPEDAILALLRTEIDYLFIENFVVRKK